jgi:phosphoribosylformylglycinamidine synthase PurS subunit
MRRRARPSNRHGQIPERIVRLYKAHIRVTLRTSILDPQGKAVEHAVTTLGIPGIRDVRIGKYVVFSVDAATEDDARRLTAEVCTKLLANPVMEDYTFDIERA